MARYRLGIADRLESRPLAWGFLKGHHSDLFEPLVYPAARVAQLLAAGDLDIGLVPSTELPAIESVRVVPDLCIAADAGSHAAMLRLESSELRSGMRIAVPRDSPELATALRIVLAEHYDCEIEAVEHRQVEEIPEGLAGALFGGEGALRAAWLGERTIDVVAGWEELTQTPLVLSVWAVRRGVELPDLAFYFKSSLRYALSSIETLSREAGAELGIRIPRLRRYLAEELRFVMSEKDLLGLEQLLRRAHRHHLGPEPNVLEFV